MLKDRDEALSLIGSIVWNRYTPPEAIGWPPGLLEHVRCMNHNVAVAIVESIYTEQELDNKVERIILNKPEQI